MVKMQDLKVGFIYPDLAVGDDTRLALDVAVALKNQGVKVEFIANNFDKKNTFEELKTEEYPITIVGDWIPKSILGSFGTLCAFIRMLYLAVIYCFFFIHRNKPNLYFVGRIPVAVPIIKMMGFPVIYYYHPVIFSGRCGSPLKYLKHKINYWLDNIGINKADVILVNSEYTSELFRSKFPSSKQDLVVLYPSCSTGFLNGLAHAKRKPIHELAPEIIPGVPNDVVFLSLTPFHPGKHLDQAISTMSVLSETLSPEDYSRMHLIMAGDYDTTDQSYFRSLVELTHRLGVITKVTFLKSPSDKLKAALLKSSDCLIYTSTNEHFSFAPLQAMAASKPVIACNGGGACETVEHRVTGYLSEPHSKNLAKFMTKFLDKAACAKLGEMGLQRMEELFSSKKFADSCMSIITKMYTSHKT